MIKEYAHLLVNYCLEIEPGDKLYIKSTILAEPLVREVYREATRAGAWVEYDLDFSEKSRIFLQEAEGDLMDTVSPFYKMAMEEFDAFLNIMAPFNLREDQDVDKDKRKRRKQANKGVVKTYFDRTATRDLKRNTCLFPTHAIAQEAGMSLEAYTDFVWDACRLYDENPTQSWLNVREEQQRIVDHLNNCSEIQYKKGKEIDIQFSCKDRTWINSDGRTNMPSGEVFTAPVEDSVNGVVHFSYPAIYMGHVVEDVTLWVKNGYIEKWGAKTGKGFLDEIFEIEGTRRFGEAAIGTNYKIQKVTKQILYDEKIGGSIHMAIGQAYPQCGGKNTSTVHWDFISDMKNGGEIFADGEKIYENGAFLI